MSRKKQADDLISGFKVEQLLNRDGNQLPFGYFNPETEGKLTWTCGLDLEGRITSVFCMDMGPQKDKRCQYLENEAKAIQIRDELIKAGWRKIVPPKVEFTYADGKKLTRRQRRYINRKVRLLNRTNPFVGDDAECKCPDGDDADDGDGDGDGS